MSINSDTKVTNATVQESRNNARYRSGTGQVPVRYHNEQFFTTSQVAKIIGVSKKQVTIWRQQKIFVEDVKTHEGVYLYKMERVMQLKSVYHKGWEKIYRSEEPPVNYAPVAKVKTSIDTLQYPEAVDMEKYLIGVMMTSAYEEVCPKIFAALKHDDFFMTENRVLFQVLKAIYDNGAVPNMLTAFEELRKHNLHQRIDFNYLTALPAMVPTSAYVDTYIKTVRDKANLRRLMHIATQLTESAAADTLPVDKIQEQYLNAIGNINRNSNQFIFKSSTSMRGEIQAATADNQLYQDRSTGFANLDAHHQPFRPGLYVLGAVPAAGKTTFCWQLAEHFALQGESVFYFTFEITRVELWAKSIARHFKGYAFPPSVTRILNVPPDSDLALEVDDIADNFQQRLIQSGGELYVVECDCDFSADKIINLVRSHCKPDKKAPIVFVDYLQKVYHQERDERTGIDRNIRKFKSFQNQSHSTFIVVTSYNRMNYRQQVAIDSAKESGGVDYEADCIWGMQLAAMNQIKKDWSDGDIRLLIDKALKERPRKIQLKCVKHRNGETYDCYFDYFSASAHFEPAKVAAAPVCEPPVDIPPFDDAD